MKNQLTGTLTVFISGLVNPDYQMSVSGVKIFIIQPNNRVVEEIINVGNTVSVMQKSLNATVIIPNQFRNESSEYKFEINLDTDLL